MQVSFLCWIKYYTITAYINGHIREEVMIMTNTETITEISENQKHKRDQSKYFYGVIPVNEEIQLGISGMEDKYVYTSPHRDIAAVISDSSKLEYDLTEDDLRRHEAVLRKVMENYTLVPAAFGTVVYDETILKRLFRRGYQSMKESLTLVENMVELGLKVVIFDSMEDPSSNVHPDIILEPLRQHVDQSRSGELFSDKLLLNTSFLINKDKIDAFSETVFKLIEEYPTLRILYSGPWAPYNFVYIKIGRDGLEIVQK